MVWRDTIIKQRQHMNDHGYINNEEEDTDWDLLSDDDSDMKTGCLGNLVIILNTRGAIAMAKKEYPARYGLYGEIRTREFAFHFNPTGEIRYIRGLTRSWPHPWEWLKRTWGNDWVYYTVGLEAGMGRVVDWMGEYYIPCLSYESNAIREGTPYTLPGVAAGFSAWSQTYGTLCGSDLSGLSEELQAFARLVIEQNEDSALILRTEDLHRIYGGRISVLPPDTRHVDYEVIPVNIADGCLYRCAFCSVKSGLHFMPRDTVDVLRQLNELKTFYGSNLQNLNAVFIGNHDALAAGVDRIVFAAEKAFEMFGFENHRGGKPSLFLFGSAGAFLKAQDRVFETLNRLPYATFINLGLESFDDPTLKRLGKPIDRTMVTQSLERMVHLNETLSQVEITANFLLGTTFTEAHHQSLVEILGSVPKKPGKRGCVYLSPLIETVHRDKVLPMFHEIRNVSGIPAYIYLIQRL